MERYANLSGKSGVRAYSISGDSITVAFDNSVYIYDYVSTGENEVEQMKQLAVFGRGLNSFINTQVRNNYKERVEPLQNISHFTTTSPPDSEEQEPQ